MKITVFSFQLYMKCVFREELLNVPFRCKKSLSDIGTEGTLVEIFDQI